MFWKGTRGFPLEGDTFIPGKGNRKALVSRFFFPLYFATSFFICPGRTSLFYRSRLGMCSQSVGV
jgi:hypothetical protein